MDDTGVFDSRPRWTNLYLNAKSNGPSFQKDGILQGFLHRKDIVPQNPEAHAKEKEFLANVFIDNGMAWNQRGLIK